jgi:hypothetical protein
VRARLEDGLRRLAERFDDRVGGARRQSLRRRHLWIAPINERRRSEHRWPNIAQLHRTAV